MPGASSGNSRGSICQLATRGGKEDQHDRWDDLRHCISSSYADLFVTRDDELKNAFDQIKPGPRIMTVAEFAQMLRLPYSGP